MKYCTTLIALFSCFFAYGAEPEESTSKVIYGPDNRLDIYEVTNQDLLSLAASTCILASSGDSIDDENGTFTGSLSDYRNFGVPACAEEPFGNQQTLGFCTGFLVADDLIATAGHCFSEGSLSFVRFVFGFDMLNAGTVNNVFDESQVYQGVELVGRQLVGNDDWALIRVDRSVTAPGAIVLPIRRSGEVQVGEAVGVIGHPAGLPKKVAFGATTEVKISQFDEFFEANLDTYGGNSGSPIFNQDTLLVEGILVRGASDYVQQGNCFVSNQLSDESGSGGSFEDASRIARLADLIPMIGEAPEDVNDDGFIDSTDIQFVINGVLQLVVPFDIDVNEDSEEDSLDVQTIINAVLNQ